MNFLIFLYSINQKLTLAHQQMSADYDKLKQEEAEKSAKLQDIMSVLTRDDKNQTSITTNSPTKQQKQLLLKPPTAQNFDFFRAQKELFEQNRNMSKIHKDIANSNIQLSNENLNAPFECYESMSTAVSTTSTNNRKFLSAILSALPTLQLHLLISLAMVILTHQCPQYLIVL